MPVRSFLPAQMASDTRIQPTRPERASNVNVIALWKTRHAQLADPDTSRLIQVNAQRV
ncbi:MAG TPA: hypothetical protein VIX58_05750 [Anaerolineae bacterium]